MTNSITYSEFELTAALKSKDNKAFEYLYNNYKGALFTAAKQYISNEAIAEEVLQEAFTTIWKNIEKYDASKGKLFTWMYNVTRNCAINTLRSKVYKSEQKNDTIENYVNNASSLPTQEQDINKIGLKKLVYQLREDYKNVLELSYFYGYTHEEISKLLQIPEGTVKTRIRNGIIELRKKFGNE